MHLFSDALSVAVSHPTHAQDDIGGMAFDITDESRSEPIAVRIERLESVQRDIRRNRGSERPTGTEGGETGFVSGLRKRVGEKHGLALGAAATQVVLENEDFHLR